MVLQGKLYVIPALMGIMMMTAIVVSYCIAILRGDVDALFPYISDTGNEIPESSVFAQFLNMAAFLGMVTVYLRYRLIRELTTDTSTTITRLACVGLVCSLLACLGLSLVANFQSQKIPAVHFTGAAMVFGLGVVYEFQDAFITSLMCPEYNGKYIYHSRLVVAVVSLVFFIMTGVGGAVSRYLWYMYADPGADPLHWNSHDPGYAWHILSTVGEWGTGITFILYFFSFIREFKKFDISICLHMKVQHLDQEPSDLTCVASRPSTGYDPIVTADQSQSTPDEHTKLLA